MRFIIILSIILFLSSQLWICRARLPEIKNTKAPGTPANGVRLFNKEPEIDIKASRIRVELNNEEPDIDIKASGIRVELNNKEDEIENPKAPVIRLSNKGLHRGFNECASANKCHHQAKCIKMVRSYSCVCNDGFTGDGIRRCNDLDECKSSAAQRCHPQAKCFNTVGSYYCACKTGFEGDGIKTCKDFNECASATKCHSQAKCINSVGSYSCVCNNGFTGDGIKTCNDLDECKSSAAQRCHSQAKCFNTFGSYNCACKKGFEGDGVKTCKDMDECTTGNYKCHPNATCKNTVGSYICSCNEGFIGNGTDCKGIDKCINQEWTCDCNLSRESFNTSKKERLRQLHDEVDRLFEKNITTKRSCAPIIIDELSKITAYEDQEEMLDQEILIQTVEILLKIVDFNIADDIMNIMVPANNILDVRYEKSWRNMTDGKEARKLVATLQKYGVQSGNILKNKNTSHTFQNFPNVQLRVNYMNSSEFSPQDRLFNFPNASFNISRDALPKNSGAVVVVVWYKTLNSFLTKNIYDGNNYAIKSRIISASVQPEATRIPFKQPVRIHWKENVLNDPKTCVYWKPELYDNLWKSDGCKRVDSLDNDLICECDHHTAFATMDTWERDLLSETEQKSLEIVSTIGCSLSLVGVILTILAHAVLWKRLHKITDCKVPSKVLMNLCAAIGMTDILAVLAGPARKNELFCITVSILLYLSVLALFGWMLCQGIVIYLKLMHVYASMNLSGRYMKAFYAIGWGFPVFIVALLVGLNDRIDFKSKQGCWCRAGGVLFWTFIATIGIILLINVFVFVLALRKVLSTSEVRSSCSDPDNKFKKAKKGLIGSGTLLPVLGLTWVFALLVFNRDTIAFNKLFE
ncbi:CD97 antigen-like [Dendronephthya gigantea]|uniref:CD97 antigen-like n=1 Tax=Dendronephthya gigantea TaxID=151771 RepID=UPI00106DB864|nr:CD97 antigen-like [Dendronephthya gigantea]